MDSSDKKKSCYNLFEDPALMAAKENLSPEERKKYEEKGKHMYNYDFEHSDGRLELIDNNGAPMNNTQDLLSEDNMFSFIVAGIRGGLEISDLEQDDIDFLIRKFGQNWVTEIARFKPENLEKTE